MISFEIIPNLCNFEKLKKEFFDFIKEQYRPTMQSNAYGGWSILSSDGSINDGFIDGTKCFTRDTKTGTLHYDRKKAFIYGLLPTHEYKYPTLLFRGEFAKIILNMQKLKLYPERCRLILLKKNSAIKWHQDASTGQAAVRLHVPIITNKDCVLETATQKIHMPANGNGYLLFIDELHRSVNASGFDRYHIITNVEASSAKNHKQVHI